MPDSGPLSWRVYQKASLVAENPVSANTLPYVIVELGPEILGVLASVDTVGPGLTIPSAPTGVRVGIGDSLSVTIYESGRGGLFASDPTRASASIELPPQVIDERGNITIPYGGTISVAGKSIAEIQRLIEEKLASRATEPQVIVSLRQARSRSQLVSVLGEVNSPKQVPFDNAPLRVLDVIAEAGGLKFPDYESRVAIRRGGRISAVTFARIASSPRDNIYLAPGDVVHVWREPATFVSLGASGVQQRMEFGSPVLTMAEAIGLSKGLSDLRADPGAVFLYRLEARETLERAGYKFDHITTKLVPTIYVVNLNAPAGFFMAGQFKMRPRDIIYIANAPSVQIAKFTVLLRQIIGPIRDGLSTYATYKALGSDEGIIITNPSQDVSSTVSASP